MPDSEYARPAPDIVASGKGRMVSWCSPVARRGSCEPLADTAQVSSIWRQMPSTQCRSLPGAAAVVSQRATRRARGGPPGEGVELALRCRRDRRPAERVACPFHGSAQVIHGVGTAFEQRRAHIRPGSDQRSEASARARDVFLSGAHHGAGRLRLVMERGRLGRPEARRVGHALLSSVDAFVDFFESALAGDGLAFDSGADGRGRSPVGHAGP